MKKLFVAATMAISLLAISPGRSQAFWNSPQCCGGFGTLGCCVLNCCPGIHFHGPLYNYGPYQFGPGYEYQRIRPELCGAYVPAYFSTGNYYSNWAQAYPYRTAYPAMVRSPADYYQSFAPPPVANPINTVGYHGGIVPAYFSTTTAVSPR